MTETRIDELENTLAQTIKVLERLVDKEALHISLHPWGGKVGIYLSHLNIATHHFFLVSGEKHKKWTKNKKLSQHFKISK